MNAIGTSKTYNVIWLSPLMRVKAVVRRTWSDGRLIRRPARSPRPASVDRSLERPAKHEKDQHERNADHDDLPLCNRARRAHARGHPDAGRRSEPVHAMAFLASDDNARAEINLKGRVVV